MSMNDNNSNCISVVVPVYNEEKNIPELYQRLNDILSKISDTHQILFVNDGSKDASLAIIQSLALGNPSVKYINFSRNFGHEAAVSAGLQYCQGDYIVVIDADLQDPPELIETMYHKLITGYDVVYAKRKKREGETFLKKITAKSFYKLINKFSNIDIPKDTGDFRIMKYHIVEKLNKLPEKNKFFKGQVAWLGYKQDAVLYHRNPRLHGKTNYNYPKLFRAALDAFTGFSTKPLELVTFLGLIFAVISFVIIIYALISYFLLDVAVTGWTSLIISSMVLGSVQLISLGIIGEYLGRINNNILNRPVYMISDSNIDSVASGDAI